MLTFAIALICTAVIVSLVAGVYHIYKADQEVRRDVDLIITMERDKINRNRNNEN